MPGVDTDRVVHGELLEVELRELICVCCKDLVDPNDALQAPCGHIFCSSCILKSIDTVGPCCPIEKLEVTKPGLVSLKEANPIVYRMLGRTMVRCENFVEGCKWVGDLSEAAGHQVTCPRRPAHCKCCKEKGIDLERAKELITAFERLVDGYEKRVAGLQQQIGQYKRTIVEQNQRILALQQQSADRRAPPHTGAMPSGPTTRNDGAGEAPPEASYPQAPAPHQANPRRTMATTQADTCTSQDGPSIRKNPRETPLGSPRKPYPQPWRGGIFLATLRGHTDIVNSIVEGLDGTVYSGGWDGVIQAWHRQVLVATLTGHKWSVNKLVVGQDGTLYSCSDDKTIRAWRDFQCIATLESGGILARHNPVKMATVGQTLFVGYYKGGVCVFEGFKKVATIREHGRGASYIDLVAGKDGVLYFSGSSDKAIVAYRGGAVVANLVGHTGDVYSMAMGDDGTLYSLATDDTIRVWKNDVCVGVLSGLGARGDLLVGQDGALYCGHAAEPVVRAWKGKECIATLQGHQDVVVALAQSRDALLYSGDVKGNIKVWEGTG